MEGPSEGLRRQVEAQLNELEEISDRQVGDRRVIDEGQLAEVLGSIENAIGNDLEEFEQRDPNEELAAIDAWAGLASYAVARVYAPASPFPHPGWTRRAPENLRRIADKLRGPLKRIAQALGAASWSISVGFPWGVSISVGWSSQDLIALVGVPGP